MKDYKMRRTDRELSCDEALEILRNGAYGVLSTIGSDGFPYGVPVNYAYDSGKIYFHCAKNSGHKQENLIYSGRVSFTVVTHEKIVPESFTSEYASVIAFGVASKTVINKEHGLLKLVEKYSPDFIKEGEEYISEYADVTDVYEIDIEKISGKANK